VSDERSDSDTGDEGGEATAFEAMFLANYDDLLRYAGRRVGLAAGGDVVAEVFLVAWRKWGSYSKAEARLWLFGVAHNVIANEVRSRRRRARLDRKVLADLAATSEEARDPADAVAAVMDSHAALASLPWREQEALRLI
jgi:RNA polymerase sigma factor (sigma-70 family)